MKRIKTYLILFVSGLLLASCGTSVESLSKKLAKAIENGNNKEIVSLSKYLELKKAENRVIEKKYQAAFGAACSNELIKDAEIKEVSEFVKTEMSKGCESEIVAFEKAVEQYQATIEDVKKGSVSAVKKHLKQKEELDEKLASLRRVNSYLQEPQQNRIEIAEEKIENADESVLEQVRKALLDAKSMDKKK